MAMKSLNGDAPQMVRNPEGPGIKRLFYSESDLALRKGKTCAGGYGVLPAGTVMAVNTSAAGNKGTLVPFVPPAADFSLASTTNSMGAARMVANSATGHVYVSIEDSYKFVVGDQIYFQNTTPDGLVDCGVITAIDRTTSSIMADISCGAFTATNGTVAKNSYVYVVSGGTPFSIAKFILDKDVNTGVGEGAVGALAPVIISNAILYTSSLVNLTAAAITSLGAIQDGPHTILK